MSLSWEQVSGISGRLQSLEKEIDALKTTLEAENPWSEHTVGMKIALSKPAATDDGKSKIETHKHPPVNTVVGVSYSSCLFCRKKNEL